ncbi:mitochondrial genome maintenance exonuclease 1 isoform X3 [Syngnathoides biaculeatus]|uniref:mitochondrial genome maintenance exonuclease 1 isoform X3 n=1 Tax=Syngnathoides biaculeatus TaxID=300417 RepID=UPI002ADE5D60|nr:mitochondrial genome maintenance exonuclease 1 isoform X3 [Syngnathoides biaculeatus]
MFIFKCAPFAGGFRILRYTSLTFGFFLACHRSSSRRGASPYNSVDSERYSSLVKSVTSSRASSQTPETIQAEDEHVFGPVIKVQTTSREVTKLPKVMHPFSHSEDTPETEDSDSAPPVQIALNRDQGRSSLPSVTRILQATLSPEQLFFLERWKRKMVAELGEDGFKDYTKNLFRQGKLFHSALEDVLMSGTTREDDQHAPDVLGYMKSVAYILDDVSSARAIESSVRHDTLNYLGIVDCVARYRGVLCIIDWKTSEKPKPFLSNTYDNPIQVAAYAGALNNDGRYKYQVENGLIVVAYKDGSPAHAHQLNHELMMEFWEKWLIRLEEFREQRSTEK